MWNSQRTLQAKSGGKKILVLSDGTQIKWVVDNAKKKKINK